MNAISYAIKQIKFSIPEAILREAFRNYQNSWRQDITSLDERIINSVIRPRILIDCNLVGGRMAMIPLINLSPMVADQSMLVYHIPKEHTGGQTIISVLSVCYLPSSQGYVNAGINYGTSNVTNTNSLMTAAQQLGDAASNIPYISTGYVELIGENTFTYRDNFRIGVAYYLRCMLSNDENLNNINPRSYLEFAKLCEYAVKSYIYNTLIIRMGEGKISGGQELGVFKTLVDGMADSEELYRTYLNETWRATAFMNDTQAFTRFLKIQMGSGH